MATQSPHHPGPSAELALAVYLEDLVSKRRVLWIGDPSSGAPEKLLRNCRSLRVLAPQGAPRGTGRRAPRVSTLADGPLKFDPGTFDVIVVPDLRAVRMDRQERIDELRSILAGGGVLVVGSHPGGDYEALYALATLGFAHVTMLGQAPFSGWSVVDFEAVQGDYDVTFDSTMGGDEADRFLAVCSNEPTELEAFAVVRLPTGVAPKETAEPERLEALAGELRARQAEVDATNEHSEALEGTLAARTAELEGALSELDRLRGEIEALQTAAEEASASSRGDTEPAPPMAPPIDPEPETSGGDDWVALEGALRERGRELRETRAEVERRGVLVRDVVEQLREVRRNAPALVASARVDSSVPPPSDTDQSGIRGRDEVLQRALEAEAARVEAAFQVDELQGQLAERERIIAALWSTEAELAGRARGLEARVAEVHELHELAEGRLSLLGFDLAAARGRELELQRELGELRERLELELVRSRGEPGGGAGSSGEAAQLRESEARLSERVGELSGQLTACRDLVEHIEEERDHARAENLRLTALVTSLENQFEGAKLGYGARIAELSLDLAERTRSAAPATRPSGGGAETAGLHGEIEGLRARLADREAALAARPGGGNAALDHARDEADALRADLEEMKGVDSEKTVLLAEAEELLEIEAGRAMDLSSTVAARDALLTRLQMDLAEEEQRNRDSAQRAAHAQEENERLRDALMHASERVDEVEALEQRAVAAEATVAELSEHASVVAGERDEALAQRDAALATGAASTAALGDARRILATLDESIGDQPEAALAAEITAVGMDAPAPEEESQQVARLMERLEEQEAEARDQRILMRSLTAQLEERDERIQGLERRAGDGGAADAAEAEALRRELLAVQERGARLSEELIHERDARRRQEAAAPSKALVTEKEQLIRSLNESLGDKDAEIVNLKGRVDSGTREVRHLRDAAAEARAALEELLGQATANGDPGTADRIGALLQILGRI